MEQQEFHIQESMSPTELELKYRLSMEKNAELVSQVSNLKDENARLKEQLAWFQKAVYGQKSEKRGRSDGSGNGKHRGGGPYAQGETHPRGAC